MKPQGLSIGCLLLLLATPPARAQDGTPAPVARADLSGAVGWHNAHKSEGSYGNDWYNRSLYGNGSVGWYWTDHHKTEIEAGASSAGRLFSVRQAVIDGQPVFTSSRSSFSTRRVAITQQYQFFRNAWFHPFVGVGLDLKWETTSREDEPVYAYDPRSGQGRLLRERHRVPPVTVLDARLLALTGFKVYMTPRAFFRSDLRLGIDRGVDDVVLRFGFGMDF